MEAKTSQSRRDRKNKRKKKKRKKGRRRGKASRRAPAVPEIPLWQNSNLFQAPEIPTPRSIAQPKVILTNANIHIIKPAPPPKADGPQTPPPVDCAICGARNTSRGLVPPKRCHNCRVKEMVLRGEMTTESLSIDLQTTIAKSDEQMGYTAEMVDQYSWLDRAQLLAQGIRLDDVKTVHKRIKQAFNSMNDVRFFDIPKSKLIALFPIPDVDHTDPFMSKLLLAALTIFDSFDSESGKVDPKATINSFEILAALAMLCSQDPLLDRFRFLASLFAYDEHESELAEDELSLLMASVLKVFTRMELIENVPDAAVEAVAGEAFIDPEDGSSRDLVSARDLTELSLGTRVRPTDNSNSGGKDKHGRAASESYKVPHTSHVLIHMHIHLHMHLHTHLHILLHMHIHLHIHIHLYMRIHMHIQLRSPYAALTQPLRTHARTHAYTHAYTCTTRTRLAVTTFFCAWSRRFSSSRGCSRS